VTSSSRDELLVRNGKIVQAGADIDETDSLRVACERSLYVFCKAILKNTAFVTHLHLPICNWLQTIPSRRKVLLTPRGTFKTTMAMGMSVHMTIQPVHGNLYMPGKDGRNLRILFAAENEKRALSRIGKIRRIYMKNELFRLLWPDHVWSIGEQEADVWTVSRFALPRSEDFPEATFEAAGIDSGSTGGHFDVIIKDDLIGLRSRKQPELMRAAMEWWDSSHSYFDHPIKSLDYVFGTRWASEDIYSHIFESETDYDVRIYSATERPDDLPPSGDSDKRLLFPERLDRVRLEEMRRKYGELYYLNYENAPFRGGNTAFNMDLCGAFRREGELITFDETDLVKKTLAIIEKGNIIEGAKPSKPKPFYRMTAAERVEAWDEMMERWRTNRVRRIERT